MDERCLLLTSARYECQNIGAKNKKWHSKVALILSLLSEPLTPTQIQKLTKIPRRSLFRYLKFLYKSGLVEKQKLGKITLYRITQLGKDALKHKKFDKCKKSAKNKCQISIRTSEVNTVIKKLDKNLFIDNVRVHDLVVKVPIVRHNSQLKPEKLNDKIKNWVEAYFKLSDLKVTIKVTTRHVICYLYRFTLPANLQFFVSLGLYLAKFLINLERVLWQRYRILIDVEKATIINQHIANECRFLSKVLSKGKQVTVKLNRKAVSPLGNVLNQEAYAKIDFSLGVPEIETNDLMYEEKLLLMPEKVFSLDFKLSKMLDMFSQMLDMFLNFMSQVNSVLSQFNVSQANQPYQYQQKQQRRDLDYVT